VESEKSFWSDLAEIGQSPPYKNWSFDLSLGERDMNISSFARFSSILNIFPEIFWISWQFVEYYLIYILQVFKVARKTKEKHETTSNWTSLAMLTKKVTCQHCKQKLIVGRYNAILDEFVWIKRAQTARMCLYSYR